MIKNQLKIIFILLQGVLFIKNGNSQIFSGGSLNGYAKAAYSPCSPPSNLSMAGGAYSGSSKFVVYNCAAAANVSVAGGPLNGYSKATYSACSSLSNLSMAGGSYSGASKNIVYNCTAAASVSVAGGPLNGYSTANYSACSLPSYLSMAGGSYSGASKYIVYNCTAAANVSVAGGPLNGYSKTTYSACSLPSYLYMAGGSYSGASKYVVYNCSTAGDVSVAGGPLNGYSKALFSACSAVSALSMTGGSYSGEKSVTLACAAPAVLTVTIQKTDASCNQNNGTATAVPSGGTSPYSYLWSGNRIGATVTGLSAGTYTVTVTEGGSFAKATASITITMSTGPTVTTSKTNVNCGGGSDGTASVSVSGGTPPYSYVWSNASTSSVISSLTAGTYTVTVNDASSNCTQSVSITLTAPPVLVAIAGGTNVSCNGGSNGSSSVTASGGSPGYVYVWSNASTNSAISGLAANTYLVTVTDTHGCIVLSSSTVSQPSVLTATAVVNVPILCNGQTTTITVSASGGATSYSGTGTFAVSAGNYSYTITDANSCTASVNATVTQPSALTVTATSNAPVCSTNPVNLTSTVAGGAGGYSYNWTGPSGFNSTVANPTISYAITVQTGNYYIIITDANGCVAQTFTYVEVDSCFTTLSLNLYIEGYYQGSGLMLPAMYKENVAGSNTNQTDTILVALRDGVVPTTSIDSAKTILMRNGTATVTFQPSVTGQSYYLVVKHRNTLETWSKTPVAFTTNTSYNFTTANTQAYGDNLIQVDAGPARWALYNGDLNQDQNIDLIDFPTLDLGINQGLYGYYKSDLNGDGNTDLLDFPVLDANINAGIFSRHP